MSAKGMLRAPSLRWITTTCGHYVPFAPPFPEPRDEITCAVCWEPTEVAA